jgi:hypothetical protein
MRFLGCRAIALALLLFVICQSSVARADDSDAPASEQKYVAWYGYQTLLVDAAAGAMIFKGRGPIPALGGVAYVLGPIVVHASNRQSGGVVVADVALRLALPVVGALVGAPVAADNASCTGNDSPPLCKPAYAIGGAIIGGISGMVLASAIDATLLARVERERKPPRVSITPAVSGGNHSRAVGVVGTF